MAARNNRKFQVKFSNGDPQTAFTADYYELHPCGALSFHNYVLVGKDVNGFDVLDDPYLVFMLPAGSWTVVCEMLPRKGV